MTSVIEPEPQQYFEPASLERMHTALLVVDVQKDFCDGSLAVKGGPGVAEQINDYVRDNINNYPKIVASMDWHIDPGPHWSPEPDYIDSWPVHCRAGRPGSALQEPLTGWLFDSIFYKGQYEAAYSAFEAQNVDGLELADYLWDSKIEELDVVGIATDYCIRASVLDALKLGFKVNLLLQMCRGVEAESSQKALDEMKEQGAEIW